MVNRQIKDFTEDTAPLGSDLVLKQSSGGGIGSTKAVTIDNLLDLVSTSGDITQVNITAGTGLSGTQNTTSGAHTQTLTLSHLGIQSLSDPDADRILFWDDSETAAGWLTVGSNLSLSGTTLTATNTDTTYSAGNGISLSSTTFAVAAGAGLAQESGGLALSHLGIQSLSDPDADRILFWDDSAGVTAWLTVGSNLSVSGTTITATNTTYSIQDGELSQNNFTNADHTKLNGIEASATADQSNAEIAAAVEAASDSNTFTNADHTKLNGIEASADVTDATNVTAAGALMDSELASIAAVKATTGTFLSADESKLDGIEASATADQTAGEILTLLVDGVDSVHYKDGSIDEVHLNATNSPTDNYLLSYDSGSSGFTWVAAGGGSGDITSVVAGSGMTGGATSGDATLSVIGGDGITANADEVEATVDGSTIELSASDGSGAIRIKDDGVTYAKIQNVTATDRILGRDSAGAGVIEEITPANLRTMINVADGATADQTAGEILTLLVDGIDSGHYKDGSIDEVHLNATNSPTDNYLLSYDSGSSGFTWVAAGGGSGDITSVVAGAGMTGGATTGDATLNVVGGAGITANADEIELTDNGVTLAKMAGLARGSIIYGNASGDPAELVKGSNTYVLTSDGTDIAWAAASGGGSGDVAAGSTFTTAGVIMACSGPDKTIDEPNATLTTGGQGMTVSSAAATPFEANSSTRDGNSTFKFTTGSGDSGSAQNNQASVNIIAQTSANANLNLGDTASATRGGLKYKNSGDTMQLITAGAAVLELDSSKVVEFKIAGGSKTVTLLNDAMDSSMMGTATVTVNATEWLQIKVNGNTRYIPVWS